MPLFTLMITRNVRSARPNMQTSQYAKCSTYAWHGWNISRYIVTATGAWRVLQMDAPLHQPADFLGEGDGVFDGQAAREQRLVIEQVGIEAQLGFVVVGEGGFEGVEGGMLGIEL